MPDIPTSGDGGFLVDWVQVEVGGAPRLVLERAWRLPIERAWPTAVKLGAIGCKRRAPMGQALSI